MSETSDYHTFIANRADEFQAALGELQPAPDQVGVLVSMAGSSLRWSWPRRPASGAAFARSES